MPPLTVFSQSQSHFVGPNDLDWFFHKDDIKHLYMERRMTLPMVMEEMRREFNFNAT